MPKTEDQPQTANYVELDWYDESEIVKILVEAVFASDLHCHSTSVYRVEQNV